MVCRRVYLPAVQGRLRDQLLNEEVLSTMHGARQRCALWQHDYNNLWPPLIPGRANARHHAGRSCNPGAPPQRSFQH